jgi:hypothetical protein
LLAGAGFGVAGAGGDRGGKVLGGVDGVLLGLRVRTARDAGSEVEVARIDHVFAVGGTVHPGGKKGFGELFVGVVVNNLAGLGVAHDLLAVGIDGGAVHAGAHFEGGLDDDIFAGADF